MPTKAEEARIAQLIQGFQELELEAQANFLTALAEVLPKDKGGSYMENVVHGLGAKIKEAAKMLSEVKWFADIKVSKTGNVAFEATCNRRQTFFYDDSIKFFGWRLEGEEYNGEVGIILQAERARKIAEIQSWGRMGDGGESEGYLVPINWLTKPWSEILRERKRRGLKD